MNAEECNIILIKIVDLQEEIEEERKLGKDTTDKQKLLNQMLDILAQLKQDD